MIWRGECCRLQGFYLAKAGSQHHTLVAIFEKPQKSPESQILHYWTTKVAAPPTRFVK